MISHVRYSQYRIMWILVGFDLPTESKEDRKAASKFRKFLLEDGFTMFQFSIYLRHCPSRENMAVHIKRVKDQIPEAGKVSIFHLTDRQFGMSEQFFGRKVQTREEPVRQLSIF